MRILFTLLLTLCVATVSSAKPAEFVFTGIGTGTMDGASFTNAPFAILARGSTVDRVDVGGGIYTVPHEVAHITLDGVGAFTFITPTRTFVNQGQPSVGFSRGPIDGSDLLNNINHPALSTWEMLTSIGPVSDPQALLLQWDNSPVVTDGGVLEFFDAVTPATFRARVIPEPSSLIIAGASTIFLGIRRRARCLTSPRSCLSQR